MMLSHPERNLRKVKLAALFKLQTEMMNSKQLRRKREAIKTAREAAEVVPAVVFHQEVVEAASVKEKEIDIMMEVITKSNKENQEASTERRQISPSRLVISHSRKTKMMLLIQRKRL